MTTDYSTLPDDLPEPIDNGAADHLPGTQQYQTELTRRLTLPFVILSDESLALAQRLTLPTFETAGMRLYRRLTMVIANATIDHVFYPVFPPDRHAAEVLGWLSANPH